MNDDLPANPVDVQRLNALYSQQPPPPQWGMAWFGGSAPYDRPAAPMGPAPSIWPVVGIAIGGVAVLFTLGAVTFSYLTDSRTAAFTATKAKLAETQKERDQLKATLIEAHSLIKQLSAVKADTCQKEQDALQKIATKLEATN